MSPYIGPQAPFDYTIKSEIHISFNDDIFVEQSSFLLRSMDRGNTWSELNSNLPDIYSISSICSDPAGNLYLGIRRRRSPTSPQFDYFMIRSTDNGDTWIDSDVKVGPVGQIGSISPGVVILRTPQNYVSRTTDYGATWEFMHEGMDHYTTYDLTFTPDGRAVVGSSGCIYITKRPVGIAEEPTPAPALLTLGQAYPNPVGVSTQSATIQYGVPTAGEVHLALYKRNGQEVSTLVSERQSAGTYNAYINTHTLTAGLYIYRLMAGGQVRSGKLSVVR